RPRAPLGCACLPESCGRRARWNCLVTEREEKGPVMNARMIVLACLLATVGVPARSAAVVLAPTTVDVHTLEFEPTQNARPGSSGVMTIKILDGGTTVLDRKSTRLNSSHVAISYAVFCLKKKKKRRWLFYLVVLHEVAL